MTDETKTEDKPEAMLETDAGKYAIADQAAEIERLKAQLAAAQAPKPEPEPEKTQEDTPEPEPTPEPASTFVDTGNIITEEYVNPETGEVTSESQAANTETAPEPVKVDPQQEHEDAFFNLLMHGHHQGLNNNAAMHGAAGRFQAALAEPQHAPAGIA